MAQFRYVYKFMGHVEIADLHALEALSASSQSCEASMCET